MASDEGFAQFVLDHIEHAGSITYRKMFGEYGVYCNGKIIALICDNQFFLKPTPEAKSYLGTVLEAPAYPGAKPSYLITEGFEDQEWFSELIRITYKALPEPKPKKPASPRRKQGRLPR